MEQARVRNFTIEGNLFALTGHVDKHGQTRYELNISDSVLETMDFDTLNQTFADMQKDIEKVFLYRTIYERDADGSGNYHSTGKIEIEEPHVVEFEEEWRGMSDADE